MLVPRGLKFFGPGDREPPGDTPNPPQGELYPKIVDAGGEGAHARDRGGADGRPPEAVPGPPPLLPSSQVIPSVFFDFGHVARGDRSPGRTVYQKEERLRAGLVWFGCPTPATPDP